MAELTQEEAEMLALAREHHGRYVLPDTLPGLSLGRAADLAEQLVIKGYVEEGSDTLSVAGLEARRQILAAS